VSDNALPVAFEGVGAFSSDIKIRAKRLLLARPFRASLRTVRAQRIPLSRANRARLTRRSRTRRPRHIFSRDRGVPLNTNP